MPYKNPEDTKTYRDKNSEKNKEYQKIYRQSENGKKRLTIGRWKHNGLIGDYEAIYQRYKNTTHCDCCNIQLITGKTGGTHRVMDHNHKTGLPGHNHRWHGGKPC